MAYTNIDDPSAYFQAATYSGSSSELAVTNDGNSNLKPDWLWIKQRSSTENHMVVDSTRGVTKYLSTDSTGTEATVTSRVETLDTDGFTLNGSSNPVNASGATYVAWQWKANGGTTSSNTDGNITSTVQANTDAGFSIVTYTGNGSNNQTIGHGLGVQPSWWIVKRRDTTGDWWFGASSILGGTSNYLKLNSTAANAEINNIWGDSPTSSTLFRVSDNAGLNASSGTYVAYLFANKQGYSKFGSYIANANTNGPFVYTGFKPAFLMIKNTNRVEPWMMYDNKRTPINQIDTVLQADSNGAETTAAADYGTDFLSNGFKIRAVGTGYANHTVGNKYIYMAFAENPFTTSTGIPTTAR